MRAGISADYRLEAAKKAAKLFSQHPLFIKSENISCYAAIPEEFDTDPLIQEIWRANKKCYLPVLEEGRILNFALFNEGDTREKNQFSILEPNNTCRKIPPENLDLVILPLIAFDLAGNRLGTGGGYFDSTFAYVNESTRKKQHLIGLGYTLQQAHEFKSDPWDIAVEGVFTEEGYIDCSQQNNI